MGCQRYRRRGPLRYVWITFLTRPTSDSAVVSQFTLLASVKKGNKPDFHKSANAEKAKELYDQFFKKVQSLYQEERVKDGVFQAMMDVALVNDGPVGVDYTCEDGAVNTSFSANVPDANVPCRRLPSK